MKIILDKKRRLALRWLGVLSPILVAVLLSLLYYNDTAAKPPPKELPNWTAYRLPELLPLGL